MKRILNLVFPSLFFLIFVLLLSFKHSFLSQIEANSGQVGKNVLLYCIQIGFWLSGAHLLNVLVRVFFWEGIFAKTIKGTVPRLLTHFFSLIVYVITLFIIIGKVFNQELTGIWATSGVMALVLGFALRNMILDLFTGLAVNIEMPYKIGDWIRINTKNPKPDIYGQVIDINWRATRLKDEEEKVIIIPNSLISTYIISNYTQPQKKIRFETEIRLDHSITVDKAKRIIQAAAKDALKNEGFFSEPEPSILVGETNEFGIEYLVRYWIEPWIGINPANAKDKINSSILQYLAFSGLRPAYPKEHVLFSRFNEENVDSDSPEYKLKLLKQVSLFGSFNEEELSKLAENIYRRTFSKGQNLMEIGADGYSMFILSEGLLEVRMNLENGSTHKVGEISPGQFFGEMSLLTGEPRSATVTASTDIIAFEITKGHVQEMFKQRPTLMEDISKVVAVRKNVNTAAIDSLSTTDNEGSINGFAQNLLGKIKTFFH